MTAIAILILGALAVFLCHRFIRPDPFSNVFDPSILYVQMAVDIVIVIGAIAALIVWC